MQDFFPKTLHPFHIFESDNMLYAADLEKARVVELSVVMSEMLKYAETQNDGEIRQTLGAFYTDADLLEAFERFAALEQEGLLFNRGERLRTAFVAERQRRKLLVAIPDFAVDSFFDIELLSAGTNLALSHMFHHLTNHVDLHFAGTQNRELVDGMYEVDMGVRDFKRLSRRIGETYFGILTLHQEHEDWLFRLYEEIELPPILVQCHAPRGHGGHAMNSLLRHYAAMRDCDGFTAPSDYVSEFYADYVWDPSFFHTLPNGVDSGLFKPMDTAAAKRWVSEVVGDERIERMPTVGYLSRVQSEKGASVFLKLAELNPHLLFLIAGPGLGRYVARELPDNLVYVGFHRRAKLPVIYNAFDVYCFLSMSGEETFGLTVLEAMACGVPPIVPNFDGVPSVVGDAGLIADAENFDEDIATLVSYPCPIDFSEKLNTLFSETELRDRLSEKARARAVSFTWDKTARRIVALFEELHRKKRLLNPNRLLNVFAPTVPLGSEEAMDSGQWQSVLLSMNEHYEQCLIRDAMYRMRVEDGLVLSILKSHTAREAEALLTTLVADETEAKTILRRVLGLINATA